MLSLYHQISLGDIGELYKIRMARKDQDKWQGWHLDQVYLSLQLDCVLIPPPSRPCFFWGVIHVKVCSV